MANKIYTAPETAVHFTDSGGDVAWTLQNLAAGAARCSAQHDKGAGSQADMWAGVFRVQWETAPTQYETAEFYLAGGDGTYTAGNIGVSDAAVDVDALRNLGPPIAIVTAEEAAADDDFIMLVSGIYVPWRYYSLVAYNRSAADNFQNTANVCAAWMYPMPPEIQ